MKLYKCSHCDGKPCYIMTEATNPTQCPQYEEAYWKEVEMNPEIAKMFECLEEVK